VQFNVTHYGERTVFDYLLTHKAFEELVLAVAGMMYYDIRAKSGTFDMSRKTGVQSFAVLRGQVPDKYKVSVDKMEECFGKGSGIVGGKGIVEYQAFLAKKAFDVILDTLIKEITGEQKRRDNHNGKT